jgi:hypothetical protein
MRRDALSVSETARLVELPSTDLCRVRGGHGPTTEDIQLQMTQLTDSLTSMAAQIDKKTASSGNTLAMMSMMGGKRS